MSRPLKFLSRMLLVAGLFFCVGCEHKEPPAPRALYEKAGRFSYDPPAGWATREEPGLKYKIAEGPRDQGLPSSIVVISETAKGNLSAYVDSSLVNLAQAFPKMRVLSKEEFDTEDGLKGFRVATQHPGDDFTAHRIFYFFADKGNRRFAVTCLCTESQSVTLEPLFNKSMNTFRLHEAVAH